jgi:hypothetical protein
MAIASVFFTIIVVVVEMSIGWIADVWGLVDSLMVLALAVAPVGFTLLILWNREVDKFGSGSQ